MLAHISKKAQKIIRLFFAQRSQRLLPILWFTCWCSPNIMAQSTFESSTLPICIINTGGASIPDEPKLDVDFRIIYHEDGSLNHLSDTESHFAGRIGIELRGNSSQMYAQKQYGIETRDANGENLDVSLLGMPEENDWILYAPYVDISMLRNILAYNLWEQMGYWAPHTHLCELVLNNDYQGVYVLTESIKRGKERLNIAKLKEEDTTGLELTGGYIMKIDAKNNDNDLSFISKVRGVMSGGFAGSSTGDVTWLYHYPKSKNIQPSQQTYIHNYIDTVENVIQSASFADPLTGYATYIDVTSFIDYLLHSELSRNPDGLKRSTYFYKDKDETEGQRGKLKAGPVWDYNLAYGNSNFCNGDRIDGWVYDGCETMATPTLWKRLLEDPIFANALQCRWLELRGTWFSETYLHSLLDSYANDSLAQSQERHFARWEGLLLDPNSSSSSSSGGWGGGMWGGGGSWIEMYSAYRVSSYAQEMDTLKNWLSARLAWLDANLPGTCANPPVTGPAPTFQEHSLPIQPHQTVKQISVIPFLTDLLGRRVNKASTTPLFHP